MAYQNIQLKDTLNEQLTLLYPRTLVDNVVTLNEDGSIKNTLTELLNNLPTGEVNAELLQDKLTSSDGSIEITLVDDKLDFKATSNEITLEGIEENHILTVKDGKIVDSGYFFTEIN